MRWYNFQRWGPWFSWKGTAERFGHCLPSLHHSNYQWHRRQRSIPKSVTMKDGQLCCSGPGSLSTANQTGSLEHLALAYVSHNRCSQGGATTPAHPGPMELGVACLLGSPGILNEIIFTREIRSIQVPDPMLPQHCWSRSPSLCTEPGRELLRLF